MPLIKSTDTRRISPPHEPDAWYECRSIRAGDFEGLQTDGAQITLSIDLLAALIVRWSYEEPVTRDNVACLDLDTFTWLGKEITALSGIRSDEEKKDSASTSSPSMPEPNPVSLVYRAN